MKIAGRIIQAKNVITNTPIEFFAKYRGHEIHASLFKENKKANNEYSYRIVKLTSAIFGGNNKVVCSGILQRCSIEDVLMHVVNETFNKI